jgi:UDP:flavonoid glycosyltransferase YjiC (YdhE family)
MVELVIDVIGSLSKGLLHFAIPVGLDQVLQVAAVGRAGVGDIMVREPSLELRFMPSVVDC